MGSYLNPGSSAFEMALNSEIFVDKSGLINVTNRCIKTMQRFICVSRPRRFGKSMAADMLSAYYDREADAAALFEKLEISGNETYQKHLNQYDVLKINMQEFLSATQTVDEMLDMLGRYLVFDLTEQFNEIRYRDEKNLVQVMKDIFAKTRHPFVILIDEWDCLFREYKEDKDAQKRYLDFLRAWLKDKDYVALAYMTGILPIKKYGSHSALNMFTEYSMTEPGILAEYFGFTESEVKKICEEYQMNFEEAKDWYDGYDLVSYSKKENIHYAMYNPKSVVEAMLRHKYGTYWNQTETYEALKIYIQMNMDGLKDAIVKMLAGEEIEVNTGTFSNDMTTFAGKDDVLTLLVHLGYLTYRSETNTVSIPNREVAKEYINAIGTMDWRMEMTHSIESYLGKFVKVKIDRPLASRHPEHGFVYCLNYGFIPDTVSGDGEEIDAYVVGEFEAVETYEGYVVAVIKRKNDIEDKLVVCKEKGKYSKEQITALVEFQERFFETEIQML